MVLAVVAVIVEAAQGEGRAQMVGLGGVVEDEVEDHLEPRPMQPLDHGPELGLGLGRGIARLGHHEGHRVVAPVVAQAHGDEALLVEESCHGQELDRGDAQPQQVIDDGRVGEAPVGPAQPCRQRWMEPRQTFDMGLVEHRLGPGHARALAVGCRRAGAVTTDLGT